MGSRRGINLGPTSAQSEPTLRTFTFALYLYSYLYMYLYLYLCYFGLRVLYKEDFQIEL